ncbi:uncharacterized protein LOC124668441 isoform X1 [Lolium rigidum]|uniref:uncharacterized protein LOC124668441 isoform X1 n=1 Tax=Lolium rigidum TaxID=89674 RepID=UPI001F5C6706|nr:uncharacterized protein LOC124668441 isoform X1 [Lolium rigidum]
MALPSPSSTRRQDVSPRDSPTAEQSGSGNRARVDVARKTKEAEHMLANLEEEGVEIDGKMASIIDDEIARIKAEADRENIINGLVRNGKMLLVTMSSVALGFSLGVELCEWSLYAYAFKKIFYGK